jgi:hypothetical protein
MVWTGANVNDYNALKAAAADFLKDETTAKEENVEKYTMIEYKYNKNQYSRTVGYAITAVNPKGVGVLLPPGTIMVQCND